VPRTRWTYRLPETKTSTNVTERNQRFGEGSGADYLLTGETPDVSLGQLPRPGWQTACRPFPCAESSIAEYFFESFIEEMKHSEDEYVGRPLNLGLVSIAMPRSRLRYPLHMAEEDDPKGKRSRVGLCADCLYARRIESVRGSVFYLCERSNSDSRFPKYPRLPVLRCPGHTPKTRV